MTGFFWMIFWLLSLWSLGAFMLKMPFWCLDDHVRSDVLKNVLMLSMGLILYSFYWCGVGLLGWIGYPALIAWGCVSAVLIVLMRKTLIRNGQAIFVNARSFLKNDRGLQLLFFFTVSLMLVTGLRSWSSYVDGDSLVYHLYLPKLWVIMGKIGNFSFSEHALWPSFLEVCFIPAELLGSIAIAKIVSFFLYAFLVTAVGAYVFEKTHHAYGAIIAAACLASIPFFFRHAPSLYNDIAFGYFAVASLMTLELASAHQSGRGCFAIAVLSGLLMGASLSCKYIACYAVLAVVVAFFVECLITRKWSFYFMLFAGFLLGAVLTGFPYYLQAFLQYGNPVFPFAQKIFHTPFGYGVSSVGLIAPSTAHAFKGVGTSFFDFLLLPYNLLFRPAAFGGEKTSVLFLLLLPLIVANFRKNRVLLFFCVVYSSIWFSLYQGTRYLTPVFGVLSIMIGIGWSAYVPSKSKLFLGLRGLVLTGLIVFNVWASYYAYKDFFRNNNSALMQSSARISSMIADKRSKVLVVGEERVYYYDFVSVRERGFRNFTLFPQYVMEEVERLLKQEGISYLLFAEPAMGSEQALADRFDPWEYFRNFINVRKLPEVGGWKSSEGIFYRLYRMAGNKP